MSWVQVDNEIVMINLERYRANRDEQGEAVGNECDAFWVRDRGVSTPFRAFHQLHFYQDVNEDLVNNYYYLIGERRWGSMRAAVATSSVRRDGQARGQLWNPQQPCLASPASAPCLSPNSSHWRSIGCQIRKGRARSGPPSPLPCSGGVRPPATAVNRLQGPLQHPV